MHFGGDDCLNRKNQIEILENMFTWDIEEVGQFMFAFCAHYQTLDDMLEKCAKRFEHLNLPRVDYLFYREHIYIIYSELSVTIECLLKSILEESGCSAEEIRKNGHNLSALLDGIKNIDTSKAKEVYTTLQKHQAELEYFVNNKIFVETRYMVYKEDVSLLHINKVKELIMDLDSIFEKYYKYYNWIDLVYPDTM